ncbi:MAG: type II toxin-antitoxin system VapC family toxin [Verrucomicrobiota bacterium]
MFVVDTNIIAPLYVKGADSDVVKRLHARDQVWRTDPFALIEFSNVLANYERAGYLTKALAKQCLSDAQAFLRPHYLAVTHDAALEMAIRFRITGYDGRFLALAEQLGSRLVTQDAKLRAAAPRLTQSLSEALASV